MECFRQAFFFFFFLAAAYLLILVVLPELIFSFFLWTPVPYPPPFFYFTSCHAIANLSFWSSVRIFLVGYSFFPPSAAFFFFAGPFLLLSVSHLFEKFSNATNNFSFPSSNRRNDSSFSKFSSSRCLFPPPGWYAGRLVSLLCTPAPLLFRTLLERTFRVPFFLLLLPTRYNTDLPGFGNPKHFRRTSTSLLLPAKFPISVKWVSFCFYPAFL